LVELEKDFSVTILAAFIDVCVLLPPKGKHNTNVMITHQYEKKTDQRPSNMAASIIVLHALPRAVERVKKPFWVALGIKISAS